VGCADINKVNLVGNVASPANCVINVGAAGTSVLNFLNTQASIEGFTVIASGAGSVCVNAGAGSYINIIGPMIYGAAGSSQLEASFGGMLFVQGNYTVSGGAGFHMFATLGGGINFGSSTVTLAGNPAFSGSFASANLNGFMNVNSGSVAYGGTCTGPRYSANVNGSINTAGAGATFFPGDSAGVLATGGQYV
jgi:hypothetical protein